MWQRAVRWTPGTALAAVTAAVLVGLRPHPARLAAQLAAPHAWFAGAGPDRALATLAAALLWLTACWVALGLLAAAASALPGAAGRAGARVGQVLLPRVLLRVVAGTAGLGVVLSPVAAGAQPASSSTSVVTGSVVTGSVVPGAAVTGSVVPGSAATGLTAASRDGCGVGSVLAPAGTGGHPVPSMSSPSAGLGAVRDYASGPGTRVAAVAHDPAQRVLPGPAWPVSPGVPAPVWPATPAPATPPAGRTTPAGPGTPDVPTHPHRSTGSGNSRPDAPAGRDRHAERVRVRAGESLWLLAGQRLGRDADNAQIAAYWPRLYAANRTVIGHDPAAIRPGQVLRVPAPTAEETA